jgi:sterol desaturase/sphingolipid hydroxylase (fatty acid hydroxylase superfamily)
LRDDGLGLSSFGSFYRSNQMAYLLSQELAHRRSFAWKARSENMLGTILIVILVLAFLGVLPTWSHSREWGYYPTGGVGLILLIVVILLVLGRI